MTLNELLLMIFCFTGVYSSTYHTVTLLRNSNFKVRDAHDAILYIGYIAVISFCSCFISGIVLNNVN